MPQVDYAQYLDVPADSIDRPKPLPEGHYFCTIAKTELTEVEFEKGTKTPILRVSFRVTSPDGDIAEELLPEGRGIGRMIPGDYRLNDPDKRGQWQIRNLGENICKLPTKGLTLHELIERLPGQEVKVFNNPRPGQEEGQSFPRAWRTLSVHE